MAVSISALAIAVAGMPRAQAQNYPNRPIHVIIPIPPGSLVDALARRIGADVSARMGQPWIMENRPGANFIPAAEACRHAKPDGYTLCIFTTSTLTFNPVLIDKLPYDPVADFKPIINLGILTGGLVASPKLAATNMEDLRKLAIVNSGKYNFATYGPASSANVFRHFLAEKWKTDIVDVGYKGANETIPALMSGEVQMTYTALGNWADNPNDSKGRIMVVDSAKRSPILPNVPTYAEVGLDYPLHGWLGLFAPAGVPDDVIAQVNKAVGEALNEPKLNQFMVQQLMEPMVTSPKQFADYVAQESAQTAVLLRKFNIPKIK